MRIVKLAAIVLPVVLAAGCYNDKYDKLYPTGPVACDTTTVSFSADIMPVLSAKCNNAGCHDVTASGGYNLATYAGAQLAVTNGRMIGSVTWTAGFSAMPKGMPKLTDCEINKMRRWVNQGAQNN